MKCNHIYRDVPKNVEKDRVGQEDCANWDGDGCPCRVLDLAPVDVRGSLDDDDDDCGCTVSHPRWCAWNGPCCDRCSHGVEEAHADCCGTALRPGSTSPQGGA